MSSYIVYTDGSCKGNPGPGGWAYAIWKDGKPLRYAVGCKVMSTNNEMELVAIVKALLEMLKEKNVKDLTICSDSAYCVNAINMGWLFSWEVNGWKTKAGDEIKNKHSWEKLFALLKGRYGRVAKSVKIKKVKAHSNDERNNFVDKLAKSAITKA